MRLLLIWSLIAMTSPALAQTQESLLGTAGTFRSAGWAQCAAGSLAQMQGACDPETVDANLSPAERSKALVARAIKLIGLLRMEQARSDVEAALALDPRNVDALKLRARMTMDGPDIAIRDINAGLMISPTDSDLLATRAQLQRGKGFQVALADANAAVRANSGNADARWIRARILMDMKQFASAEDDLSHALLIEPGYRRARSFRALVRMRLGKAEQAIEDTTVLLDENPGDFNALQIRSLARVATNDLDGALTDLSGILGEPGQPTTADPSIAMFFDLYVQRLSILIRLGQDTDALKDLDTITKAGGRKALLQMQVYLRGQGFADLPLDGRRSQEFDDALRSCFLNETCRLGLSRRI